MKLGLLPVLSLLAVAACSSGSGGVDGGSSPGSGLHGSASATGYAGGASSSFAQSSYTPSTQTSSIDVLVGGDIVTCSATASELRMALGISISLHPISATDLPKPVTPDTYKIGLFADGDVSATIQTSSGFQVAEGGTITLTTITATLVEGTFEVYFNGGSSAGSFSAPLCPAGS